METKAVRLPERRVMGIEHVGNPWGLVKCWEQFQKIAAKLQLHAVAKNYMSLFPVAGENGK